MHLTEHFTLDELTVSQEAARKGLDNDPPLDVITNLRKTATGLEMVRETLGGRPLLVSSGYRSVAVNSAVGGSPRSQHLTGHAVDFTCPSYGTPYEIVARIRASEVPYDQIIVEFGRWVHISFIEGGRRQALIIDRTGTRVFA